MRNLGAYPVTTDEIVKWLKLQVEKVERQGLIGSMTPVLAAEAIKSVLRDQTDRNELGLTPEIGPLEQKELS